MLLDSVPLEVRYFLYELKIFGTEILAHNLDEMKYKEKKMHPYSCLGNCHQGYFYEKREQLLTNVLHFSAYNLTTSKQPQQALTS